jgi:hypothetical protein
MVGIHKDSVSDPIDRIGTPHQLVRRGRQIHTTTVRVEHDLHDRQSGRVRALTPTG